MPTRPSKATANELWALAGNECANPDCDNEVMKFDPNSGSFQKVGQIAHIKGAKKDSNRYDANQSDQERHSVENLLILCPGCHTGHPDGVDIPANEKQFPVDLLRKWKERHLAKIQGLSDRNWLCHPNAATLLDGNESVQVSFWIDQRGRQRLYTNEQLAIVTQLQPLIYSFGQIQELLRVIEETGGEPVDKSHQTINDAYVNSLYRSKQRVAENEYGWIGYLAESMQVAQDVTLGEVFAMMAQDGLLNREKNREEGKKRLKDRAAKVDPKPKRTKIHRYKS